MLRGLRAQCVGVAMPPAGRMVGPSVPSVPRLTTMTWHPSGSAWPANAIAALSASSWFRPPMPPPRMVTVVSPPSTRHMPEAAIGLPGRDALRQARDRAPTSRASPCTNVVSRVAWISQALRLRGDGRPAIALSPMTTLFTRPKMGSPAFGVSGRSPAAPLAGGAHACRDFVRDAVARQDVPRIAEDAAIGHGRAGRDGVERRADHVGEDQRGHLAGAAEPGQLAALQPRAVLAHRVDLGDVRARAQQQVGQLPVVR